MGYDLWQIAGRYGGQMQPWLVQLREPSEFPHLMELAQEALILPVTQVPPARAMRREELMSRLQRQATYQQMLEAGESAAEQLHASQMSTRLLAGRRKYGLL